MTAATVFIVDDDAAVRDSLTLLCEARDLDVECHASAEAFLAAYRPASTGCLVLDVRMGPMSGPDLHAELTRRGSRLPIIYLTGHGDIPLSVSAMKAGAANFLTKPVDSEELIAAIRSAFLLNERQLRQSEASRQAAERLASLSEREREVMLLAVKGMSNKLIARHLGISHRTVEIHKSHIMQKTGTATLLQLARLAADGGLAAKDSTPDSAS
jgi:RNA polymerase sigma factor (sigma-70 family)